MPYMPWSPNVAGGGIEHCGPWVYGPYVSRQVNVDANGCNIVGDAANEPSIAIDPTNPDNIVIGWRQFDSIESDFRQSGWAYSHDGGETWTFPGSIQPGTFGSDPVLATRADGTFFYHSTSSSLAGTLYESSDQGVTWHDTDFGCGGDKPWVTFDTTEGVGRDNFYCTRSPGISLVRATTDWSWVSASLPRPAVWGTITVAIDGVVFVAGASGFAGGQCPAGLTAFNRSLNIQDTTQSPTVDLSSCVDLGGVVGESGVNGIGLAGQLWVATDLSLGNHDRVYLLATTTSGNVQFIRSTDGGTTWGPPIQVNDDNTTRPQWFGMMSVSPNGRIDAVWNDERNHNDFRTCELYYAHSTDGGESWSTNIQLSLSFDKKVGYPGGNNKLGDYYHMVSDDTHVNVAYAATFNNEQDVYFLRFPAFDCNQNGISDPEDISNGVSFDCDGNSIPDECQLLIDCNSNGIFDPCDVSGDESEDCDSNSVPDECQLFLDCNSNAIFDPCDTASGASADCDLNRVPDECEPDCNKNLVADICDITDHTSVDCNFNLIPDECEEAGDFDDDGLPNICDPDIDNDGVANGADVCDQSPHGFPVRLNGAPVGDANLDCQVSLFDYAFFDDCLANGGPSISLPSCAFRFGVDADSDIDLVDFANFQRVFGTP